MAATRIQRAYQSVTDEGVLKVHIYSPIKDEDGKQKVVRTVQYNAAELPLKMQAICVAKGLGFYMAGRYSNAEDCDNPDDIAEACDSLFAEMEKGTFVPGRGTGDGGRPSPFFEALAEYLKMPVHLVIHQVREDKVKFSAGKLAQFAKHPPIAAITARIEQERAKEKAAKAKAALKDAEDMDIASLFDLGGEGGAEREEAA